MTYPIITSQKSIKDFNIGGKAKNLFRLIELGFNVPKFVVIPHEVLNEFLPQNIDELHENDIIIFLKEIVIPEEIINEILSYFSPDSYFAVRSSASDEDNLNFSFAGQYESYLFVNKDHLAEKIKSVWSSLFLVRVIEYRKNNNISGTSKMAVIIQEMINADVSGVAFGINPINKNQNEKLINSVYGLGEGLVSGELDADMFIIRNSDSAVKQIHNKTHKIVFDSIKCWGVRKVEVNKEFQNLQSLTDTQINELEEILDKLNIEYQTPQDIEFAIKENTIFLTQTRPITTLNQTSKNPQESYIVWDNSNIIESYPGVTTPLTFSFISQSYKGAYKLFCEYMGVSPKVIKNNERVFANTLGFINGRVYYNLKSWYYMLAMVPGYSINARFMENMMGVKERFDVPESYRLSHGKAFWQIFIMAIRMYFRLLLLPKKKKEFFILLNDTIKKYKKINFREKNAYELMDLYYSFESTLLNQWKAPLINDFFAMIGYGRLQKLCQKYLIGNNPNIHNDLLCGSGDIISTQPIHRSIAIASKISKEKNLKELFIKQDEIFIWKNLNENKSEESKSLKLEIDNYIEDFGERCIGELKLETVSYTQDPTKFIKILKAYVVSEITLNSTSGKIEEEIRITALKEVNETLKGNWYKKFKMKRAISRARELVSARENLRYERTRAFGIVREIFSGIGYQFYSNNIINAPSDVFYLTKDEIFSFIEGTSVSQNIRELIGFRKHEFETYRKQNVPSERFSTSGIVYHDNDFFNINKLQKFDGDLNGIGCCPGIVRAKVQVIFDPINALPLNGDILITSSTDPGWVTLFPSASGIITERGSVLSHSAIVSREMGKPCIVGVQGLLKTLKTGDEIIMNGSTGAITLIK